MGFPHTLPMGSNKGDPHYTRLRGPNAELTCKIDIVIP